MRLTKKLFENMIFKMILSIFGILLVVSPIFSHPQFIPLPETVNDLREHHHIQRSISSAQHIPSINELQETVKEVEAMIKANPSLPRLTRGEILDLLENITKSDELKNTSDRAPKAIMVVQAYTPENMAEYDMEDLYTKPPVTHIVTKSSSADDTVDERKKSAVNNLINTNPIEVNKLTTNKMKKFRGDNSKLSATTTTTTTTTIPPFSPIVANSEEFNRPSHFVEKNKQHRRRRPMIDQLSTTTYAPSVTTYSSKSRRPMIRRPSPTNKYPNHKYIEEAPKVIIPNEGLKVVEPPKFDIYTINEDVNIMEDNKKDTLAHPYTKRVSIESTVASYVTPSSSVLPPIDLEVPGHLRDIVSQMDLSTALEEDPLYQQSVPTITKLKYTKIQQNHPAFNFLPSSTSTTTTSAMPDISNVVDSLSPEMRDLLASFGLIPNFQEQTAAPTSDSFNPIKAEVKAESYVGFKPLPDDDDSKSEMDELLARFGLGRSARNMGEKQRKIQRTDNSGFDIVPEEYLEVLGDMGFTEREGKKIQIESLTKPVEKQHVFNPKDTKYATQEELDKLSRLVDVIKQLENLNRTATDKDLKNIDIHDLKELVASFNVGNTIVPLEEQNAPNPLNFDFGQHKNDFKRQENVTTTTTTTTAVPTIEAKTTLLATTTEESRSPSIKDLEDSFGGQAETVTQSIAPETTTPARRTGFYMLVDWNTFLDIDDQKGKRVNLRFQPTVGDPKRFYSVSVP